MDWKFIAKDKGFEFCRKVIASIDDEVEVVEDVEVVTEEIQVREKSTNPIILGSNENENDEIVVEMVELSEQKPKPKLKPKPMRKTPSIKLSVSVRTLTSKFQK